VLFNSPVFFVFFICYLIVHWLTPQRFRLWTMIAGSTVFYGYWNWVFTGLPFALVLLAFLTTWWTVSAAPGERRLRLGVSIVVLLTPLLVFKYTNFIWHDVIGAMVNLEGIAPDGRLLNFALPLGISFVTFTLIAYLVDVSTGRYPAPASPRWLLGYTLFFPHLIAGPILRPHELIPQLQRQMPIRRGNLLPGLALFTSGLIKKMVFADPIGAVVTAIYAQPDGRGAAEYLFALYGFSVQIYCDFSGYTDMALGTALILGVRLPGNFLRPYLATSIADFWRRWHITLSHWLRDYIYIPLGGSRDGTGPTIRNVIITARRQLDLPDLGPAARHRRRGKPVAPPPRAALDASAAVGADSGDLSRGGAVVGVVPRPRHLDRCHRAQGLSGRSVLRGRRHVHRRAPF
jgi:alginate O-acetyltransferase complex protein AlgI